jgi:hypothetical protein
MGARAIREWEARIARQPRWHLTLSVAIEQTRQGAFTQTPWIRSGAHEMREPISIHEARPGYQAAR